MRRAGERASGVAERGVRGSRAPALLAVLCILACGWEPPGSSTSGGQVATTPSPGAGGQSAPSTNGGQQPVQGGLQPPGYRLVWNDEFTGSSLDPSRWSPMAGQRRDAVNSPDAISLAGGSLIITTYTANGIHTTGFLSTEPRALFTFGYFEARIRLHGAPGSWCAFWLNSPTNGTPLDDPATAGTEIDVLENRVVDQFGNDVGNINVMNVNWNGYGADHRDAQQLAYGSPSLQDNWHTYGVLWTSTGYTYYVDGVPVWTPGSDVPVSRRSEYLYLTCEVEDRAWSGNIPAGGYGSRDTSRTKMEVDWVRVWQPAS